MTEVDPLVAVLDLATVPAVLVDGCGCCCCCSAAAARAVAAAAAAALIPVYYPRSFCWAMMRRSKAGRRCGAWIFGRWNLSFPLRRFLYNYIQIFE